MITKEKDSLKTLEEELAYFTGTEHYYRHWLGFNYTDGISFLAKKAECFWLLDAVGSYQKMPKVKKIDFQLWILKVNENKSAVLEMKEDTDKPALVRQKISYTTFPMQEIELYFQNNVLFLPSEY